MIENVKTSILFLRYWGERLKLRPDLGQMTKFVGMTIYQTEKFLSSSSSTTLIIIWVVFDYSHMILYYIYKILNSILGVSNEVKA